MAMRVKRMGFSAKLLLGLVSGTYRIVKDPLPADARYVQMVPNPQTGEIELFVESETFPEVVEGGVIPRLTPPSIEALWQANPTPSRFPFRLRRKINLGAK
jgi:hypothetical protein